VYTYRHGYQYTAQCRGTHRHRRRPTAASWLAGTIRQIKGYVAGANHQIRHALSPEFDEIREPFNDLICVPTGRTIRWWPAMPVESSTSSSTTYLHIPGLTSTSGSPGIPTSPSTSPRLAVPGLTKRLIQCCVIDLVRHLLNCNNQSSIKIAE
jgi:hypothetical protein